MYKNIPRDNIETGRDHSETESEDLETEIEATYGFIQEKEPAEFDFLLGFLQIPCHKHNESSITFSNSIGPFQPIMQFSIEQQGHYFQMCWS